MVSDIFRNLVEKIRVTADKRLYRQWTEHYDLPPREVRVDQPKIKRGSLYQQWVEEGSLAPEDLPQEKAGITDIPNIPKSANPVLTRRLIEYIIVEAIVIVVLLIILAVAVTVCVMK